MAKLFTCIILMFVLTGCAAEVLSSNPRSVVLENVRNSNVDSAFELAQKECSKHGRYAVYVPDAQQDGVITFRCEE